MIIKQYNALIFIAFITSCTPKPTTATSQAAGISTATDLQFKKLLIEAKQELDSTSTDTNLKKEPQPTSKASPSSENTPTKATEDKNKDPSINNINTEWKKSLPTKDSTEGMKDFKITSHFKDLQKKSTALQADTKEAKEASNELELTYNNKQFRLDTKWQAGLAIGSDSDEGSFLLVISAGDDSNNQALISIKNDFDASHKHLETLPVVGIYTLNSKSADLTLYTNKTLTHITHGEIQIITLVNGTIFGFFAFGDTEQSATSHTGVFQGKIDIFCLPIYSKKYCAPGWEAF